MLQVFYDLTSLSLVSVCLLPGFILQAPSYPVMVTTDFWKQGQKKSKPSLSSESYLIAHYTVYLTECRGTHAEKATPWLL